MADQKKNDVAAALAALAGGAIPSEGETPSGGIPSETSIFSPPPPPLAPADAAPLPKSVPSTASRSRPPGTPQAPRSPAPQSPSPGASTAKSPRPLASTQQPSPPADARPKPTRLSAPPNLLPKNLPLPSAVPPPARIRPSGADGVPRLRPAMPERSVKPVEAPPAVPESESQEFPDTIPEMVEDEETIAAAPDASAFARRVVLPKPAHTPLYANLFFRRTLIPILLTCGVMLLVIGLWSMIDHNAPLATMGTGAEFVLIVVGIVLLGFGVLNALQVKQVLEGISKSGPGTK